MCIHVYIRLHPHQTRLTLNFLKGFHSNLASFLGKMSDMNFYCLSISYTHISRHKQMLESIDVYEYISIYWNTPYLTLICTFLFERPK